ncbi:MAG: head maturation protease, ClpP-related [Bacteroidota bacterium]
MKKVKFWIVNELSTQAAEILMYGYIGEYEAIDDAVFLMDLRNLESKYKDITIRVNCGGGDVYKGMAIFNAIRQSKANIYIKIDGIAASMGAVFPLAAPKGKVSASKYARIMTHRVSGIAIGNADDLRNQATEMEQWEDNISDVIATRTGTKKEDAKKKYIVNKDRWISAEQALAEGLIDTIYDADPVDVPADNNPENVFNSFQKIFLNKSQQSQPKKYKMKKELLKKLNLADDASDDAIDAAVEKVLTEKETADNAAKTALKAKAKTLVDGAIAAKKLTEADRAEYEGMAETNYEFTAKAIEKIQAVKSITSQLTPKKEKKGEGAAAEEESDYEALLAKGKDAVAEYKKENFSEYKKMWEAHYKAPYPEPNA